MGVDAAGPWVLSEHGWNPARANYYETLFTVGNGYIGTRGTLEEGHVGVVSGSYLAGVYDAHDSQVIDLVNVPDWLETEVHVDGERLDADSLAIAEHHRHLDLRTGVLSRETVFVLADGSRVRLHTQRLAAMADRHQLALRVAVTCLDRDAQVTVTTGLNAHRWNMESLPIYPEGTQFGYERKWDKWSRSRHLVERGRGFVDGLGFVVTETIDSAIEIALAMSVGPQAAPTRRGRWSRHERIAEELSFDAAVGVAVVVDKVVGVATSRDHHADADPLDRAIRVAREADGFAATLDASARVWADLWESSDCLIVGDDRAALAMRFSIYHLLIAANPDDPTVNIGAKSLSGEGYRGHVFWDTEIMMLPFFLFTQPRTARALLGYRHHTLPGAREVATTGGDAGARYPWESAASGREECPISTPDGQFRFWTRDEELHVTGDVAYAIARYAEVTGDHEYLYSEGAEIVFETARFWLSRLADEDGRLVLTSVMGPDEFHSHVDNNAFTNRLVRWHLEYAVALYDAMAKEAPDSLSRLSATLGLHADERASWEEAAPRVVAPTDPDCGLIEQYDGYFDQKDVPITHWDANDMPQYPAGYHHFNCEDTMLLKQPDVVQLMFQFPDLYSVETRRINYEFYEKHTLHKSSLSPSVHAIVGLQVGDSSKALQYFTRSAFVDLDDNQGNTEDGMHIASAAGTWQIVVNGFCGFLANAEGVRFDPDLPAGWSRVRLRVQWRGRTLSADIGHTDASFRWDGDAGLPITVGGNRVDVPADREVTVELDSRHGVAATGAAASG